MTAAERLDRVERELAGAKARLRHIMIAGIVAAAGALALLAASAAMPEAHAQGGRRLPADVWARRIVVVDDNGEPRGALLMAKDGISLSLCDGKGKIRVMLDVSKDRPALTFLDGNGNIRALMGERKKEGPALYLFDANGKLNWSTP